MRRAAASSGRPRAASACAVARAESLGPVGDWLRALFRVRRERLRLMTMPRRHCRLPPALSSRPSAPSLHRSSRWGEGRGEGQVRAPAAWADLRCRCGVTQRPRVPLPLTPTLSPRREERRGERGRADPAGRLRRMAPVPERCRRFRNGVGRAGAQGGGFVGEARAASASAVRRAESLVQGDWLRARFRVRRLRSMTMPRRHCPGDEQPAERPLSPRREERRGERGRAHPAGRCGRRRRCGGDAEASGLGLGGWVEGVAGAQGGGLGGAAEGCERAKGESLEPITQVGGHGFRVRHCVAPRNDEHEMLAISADRRGAIFESPPCHTARALPD